MEREIFKELREWKSSLSRKPLILHGARQVGKTWIMQEFGKLEYENVAYINFDSNSRMEETFKNDLNISRIVKELEIETNIVINENTLIIFDEIQENPNALKSLKYFQENKPQYHIMAAGSFALKRGVTFPVGKVDFKNVYPLNFKEFLNANNELGLLSLLENLDYLSINNFKTKYIELLKQYYYVGGMPEVVNSFIQNKDFHEVRKIQESIITGYDQDFSKYAPLNIVPRIRMIWNSIGTQLSKENKKFIYGLVKEGARAKDFEVSLMWLIDCGLVYSINNVSKPGLPLKSYEEFNSFKLFLVDVGLLGALVNLDLTTIIEGNKIFSEFKGSLSEQFVLQQFKSNNLNPMYFSKKNSSLEIDFLLQYENNVIPIEVKAEQNLQAKSFKFFIKEYESKYSFKISMNSYKKEDSFINLPLYMCNYFFKTFIL